MTIAHQRWAASANLAFIQRDSGEVEAQCYASPVQKDSLSAGQDAPVGTPVVATPDEGPEMSQPHSRRPGRFRRGDVLGLGWVLISGIAVLVPFLIHGSIFGPIDLAVQDGLTREPGVAPHIAQNSDLANSLIPWWTLVWQQVHHGHLPLWNPYAALGTPLAFNWQSAPLSLPALVGYAAPLRYAFTVGVIVNIAVAGSGGYVLGRVLGLGVVASAAVGTVFELSGPITAWLGYPFPAVMGLAGWILAFGLLLIRGRHRAGYLVATAVCVAFSFFGGAPEGFAVLMLSLVAFFGILLLQRARWLGGSGPILRPAVDLGVAVVAGGALAAPFALPGIQLARQSIRGSSGTTVALAPHVLLYTMFQTFGGLPIYRGGRLTVFDPYSLFYTENAMYVGVAALVLATLAVILHRRRPEVRAFAIVTALCLALVFVSPIVSLADKLPLLGQVGWLRAEMPMALAIAVLAGYGIDFVVRRAGTRVVGSLVGGGFSVAALFLLGLWLFGRRDLSPAAASIRAHSFIWPAAETLAGLATAGFLVWVYRQGPMSPRVGTDGAPPGSLLVRWAGLIAGVVLLSVQTAYLVSAGAQTMESSPNSYPQTPVIRAYSAAVGSAVVANGPAGCHYGIGPNVNDAYAIRELAAYDPIIPKRVFVDWEEINRTTSGAPGLYIFCPPVTTVALAREYGVGFVLEGSGHPGPSGSVFVRRLADEDLYRIPGSGEATVAPLSGRSLPPDEVAGVPVTVHHPSPSVWKMQTESARPTALRLHLTNVPGWRATIDGRPLTLEPYVGSMLQARVPAGSHAIVVRYWPKALTEGIVLALISALFLLSLLVWTAYRKRHSNGRSEPGPDVPVA